MSGRWSRNKGAAFERLIANALKPYWPTARRGIGQARSAGEVADVEGTPYWFECKRQKRCSIKAAIRQAEAATDGRPVVVVTKDDGGEILATYLETWNFTKGMTVLLDGTVLPPPPNQTPTKHSAWLTEPWEKWLSRQTRSKPSPTTCSTTAQQSTNS